MENDKIKDNGMEKSAEESKTEQENTVDGETLTEEEKNLRKLGEENEKLRREIERVRNLSVKERLYDKVNVSVRTLDIFIAVMVIFGIIVVILGMR